MNTKTLTVLNALKALSNVCDGAVEHDNVGFNGIDAQFGKSLAANETLTPKQAEYALKMLRKYITQLGKMNITLPTDVEDEFSVEVKFNSSWIVVRLSAYNPNVISFLKGLKGVYHPEKNKAWVLTADKFTELSNALEGYNLTVIDTTAQKAVVTPKIEVIEPTAEVVAETPKKSVARSNKLKIVTETAYKAPKKNAKAIEKTGNCVSCGEFYVTYSTSKHCFLCAFEEISEAAI